MSDLHADAHERTLQEVRTRFVADGYDVSTDVEELDGSRPDLVARRGMDVVVIAVRLAGTPTAELTGLAQAVARRPGWRLVIATGPGPAATIDVLSRAELAAMIAEAKHLPSRSTAAPLVAWAALESALRSALVRMGHHLPSAASQPQWIHAAASNGLVSPDEEERLQRFAASRNRLAHGQRLVTTIEPDDVAFVLGVADRFVAEAA